MAYFAPALMLVDKVVSPEEEETRQTCLKRWWELDTEYTSGEWKKTHQDIIDFIQPNHGQFLQTDTNRGSRKDERILNNTASDRAKKLSAAIDVGVCSEAREWFVVGTEDAVHMEDEGTREFCHSYQEAMFAGLAKVGWYAPNRNAIDDTVGPAIGLVLIEEDPKSIARCTHVPVGQYRVGADSRGEVNVVAREFTFTAAQMVQEFGLENCSPAVRKAMSDKYTQSSKHTVLHLIEERSPDKRQYGKIDAKNMPWGSWWLELGQGFSGTIFPGQADSTMPMGPRGILRESGYQEQPFYCYRWNQIGQNAYGTDSPGWNGLGDVKQLQDIELGSATMLALLMKPPMNRPDELANASLLPGADNPIPSNSHVKFEPSYQIDAKSITVTAGEKREIENRLNNVFFGDILFAFSDNIRQAEPKTAEEIRGIKEERLLQLGGVFSRISDQLRIALKRLAGIFQRAGLLPQPPPELLRKGRLRIEFVNPLVTAQKAQGFDGMLRVIDLSVRLAEAKQAGADKLDADEFLDTATEILGVKPNLLLSDEEVARQRQARADQMNAAQQGAALPAAAKGLKDISQVDPEQLRETLTQFGPNAVAQGTTPGG